MHPTTVIGPWERRKVKSMTGWPSGATRQRTAFEAIVVRWLTRLG